MRRACGAPAPRPGKGLRPLTLFRNDAEQGMSIASARCAALAGLPPRAPARGVCPLTRYAMIRNKVSRSFLRDAPCEHTKPVAFNQFSHAESPNMRKIFCTCRITLRTSNSPCAVRKRKKAQRKTCFPLRLFWRLARIFIENPVGGVRRPAHGLEYIIS